MIDVAARLRSIREELSTQHLERRTVIEALMLAVLAKEHVYVHGEVGSDKSNLVRHLVARITGATYFETSLSRTRPDAAVLGPFDLPLLQATGDFRRKITGYLLTANFTFLDEIGKMSATLGHDLLPALNERIRHEVSEQGSVQPIPLYTAFTASNELPAGESEDAAALWDRLLVRCCTAYIESAVNFGRLLTLEDPTTAPTTVPFVELAYVIDEVVPQIALPDKVIDVVAAMRARLREVDVVASDRRWRASMKVLRARAFLQGRAEVTTDDLRVLELTLWNTPDQVDAIHRVRAELSDPVARDTLRIMDEVRSITGELEARKGESVAALAGFANEQEGKIEKLKREVTSLEYHHGSEAGESAAELRAALAVLEQKIDKALAIPDAPEGTS